MIRFDFSKNLYGSHGEFCLEVRGEIRLGERVSIFGKSGVGKSTVLRVLAGLLCIDRGFVRFGDEIWNDQGYIFPPQKRNVGLVFQNHTLFPNLNIYENISYAKNVDLKRVDRLIEIMELQAIAHLYPSKLSGGQAQRVALARALASKPKILLLDEPFSALDMQIKYKLIKEILLLHQEFGFTLVLISHNMEEVVRLSDRVLFLENGKIQKVQNINEISCNTQARVLSCEKNGVNMQLKLLINHEVVCCEIPIP